MPWYPWIRLLGPARVASIVLRKRLDRMEMLAQTGIQQKPKLWCRASFVEHFGIKQKDGLNDRPYSTNSLVKLLICLGQRSWRKRSKLKTDALSY